MVDPDLVIILIYDKNAFFIITYKFLLHNFNAQLRIRRVYGLHSSGTRRILGYRWKDFVPHHWLFHETESSPVAGIVLEWQFWKYGHVSHVDPAYSCFCRRQL